MSQCARMAVPICLPHHPMTLSLVFVMPYFSSAVKLPTWFRTTFHETCYIFNFKYSYYLIILIHTIFFFLTACECEQNVNWFHRQPVQLGSVKMFLHLCYCKSQMPSIASTSVSQWIWEVDFFHFETVFLKPVDGEVIPFMFQDNDVQCLF